MDRRIKNEIRAAAKAGKWETPWRPFHDDGESCGAMKCCRCRKKPTVVVSYLVDFAARMVLCQRCYDRVTMTPSEFRDARCKCRGCRRWMKRRPNENAPAQRRPSPNAGRCTDCAVPRKEAA